MVRRTQKTNGAMIRNRHADLPSARRFLPRLQFEWVEAVTDEQWKTYCSAIQALRGAGIRFMLGGGFALANYVGRWRNTKDIDLYIMHEDRDKAVEALTKAGFADYFAILPYDRRWIYRSTRDGLIVDIIWAMANQRAQTDELWFERARETTIRGEKLAIIPMEEFLWCKLYIMQRDHCDWTDAFNLIYAIGPHLDWGHLLARLEEEDWPLLKGVLTVYGWLCPRQARKLPRSLVERLDLPEPQINKKRNHIRLLDTRGWFAAILPKAKPLEV